MAKAPCTIEGIRHQLQEVMPYLRTHYGVRSLALFGSYVRGEATDKSDLDILVEFDTTPSLIQFLALENFLSDLLGVRVDLVLARALKPHIGQAILREAVPV